MNEQDARRAEDFAQRVLRARDRKKVAKDALMDLSSGITMPRVERSDLRTPREAYPTFDVGLSHIDAMGAGCGLTSIGGRPGTGKSTLAIGAGLFNATAERQVIYFDAENDAELAFRRVKRWFGPDALDRFDAMVERDLFIWVQIETGQMLRQLAKWITEQMHEDGCLIVFDSLTTIARMLCEEDQKHTSDLSYLRKQTKIAQWAQSVSRRTCGRISFLALAELNAAGGMKGVDLEYISNTALSLERYVSPEEPDRADLVKVRIIKNRSGPTDFDGRVYVFDWRSSSFTRYEVPR